MATRIPFASVVTSVAGCGTRIGRWRGSALATLLYGPAKLLYAAANIISIGLGVYKFSNMGIIPVQPADWAGLYPAQSAYESNQVLI